jgi:hypothetical protein
MVTYKAIKIALKNSSMLFADHGGIGNIMIIFFCEGYDMSDRGPPNNSEIYQEKGVRCQPVT